MGAYETQSAMAGVKERYTVLLGASKQLTAAGSMFVGGTPQYAWDFDSDGQFDDAFGASPTFSTAGFTAPTSVPISVRVSNAGPSSAIASTTLKIVPPVVHVDTTAFGAADGTSWANARADLATVMAEAVPGQEIRIANGTFIPTAIGDPTASFQLEAGVKVSGGYAGFGAADPNERDVETFETVFSGNIGVTQSAADNSLHVLKTGYVSFSAQLDGVTITAGNADNRLGPGSGEGGGMTITKGSPTLRNVTLIRNAASSGAGIMARPGSAPTLIDCSILGNTASGDGGGMFNDSASPTLVNCIVAGNAVGYGGAGLYNDGANFVEGPSNPTLINCTFTGNANTLGGGSAFYDYYAGSTVKNSILWGNTSPNGSPIVHLNASTVVTHSDVQGGYTGAGNIDADPAFVRNPGKGADNLWGTADDDYGDLRLQLISACVDSGNNAAVPVGITTDIAGDPRIFDFPGSNDPGAIVDMGAFELGMRLGLLRVPDGQTLALPQGNFTFIVEALSIGTDSTLDVRDDSLVIEYSNPNASFAPAIEQLVASGYNTGDWLGKGIISSTAANDSNYHLGIADNASLAAPFGSAQGGPLFDGIDVDDTCVLVKFTHRVDLNLDGVVTDADAITFSTNFEIGASACWSIGDLNMDGVFSDDDSILFSTYYDTNLPPV
jgi:hypothetical protein